MLPLSLRHSVSVQQSDILWIAKLKNQKFKVLITCIIFDMDGVLFDSEPLHIRFEQLMFRKMKINLSENQKMKFVGLGDYKVWELLKETFQLKETLEQLLINDRKGRISFFIENETIVMPGARELLERLKASGFRLALASSSQIELIDLNLSRAGFSHFFDVKVSNDMVTSGKPSPDIFLYTAGMMNVAPQNCIVIEDSENGLNAAKSAGMKCIAFTHRPDLNQDISKADASIDDLLKITPELIQALGS
jgi:HAD superfamily hydrolase (TIGR01509 family)